MFIEPEFKNLQKTNIVRKACTNYLAFIDSPFIFYLFKDDKRGRKLKIVLEQIKKEFPDVQDWYDVEVIYKDGCIIFSGDYYE